MFKKILFANVLLAILMPSIALSINDRSIKIVETWAKAVKERDGKKQYQLLCVDQQKKTRAILKSMNWVTGISSPQIGDYTINKLKQKKDKAEVLLKYQIILSGKPIGTVSDSLQVKNGCISKFKYLSPSNVRPTR